MLISYFNSDTFVDDHIKLSYFQIGIQAESNSFSEIKNTFCVESANLSSVSEVSTMLGQSFAFVNTYKHIMVSNNEMHVNLTFGGKHEKSIETDCK